MNQQGSKEERHDENRMDATFFSRTPKIMTVCCFGSICHDAIRLVLDTTFLYPTTFYSTGILQRFHPLHMISFYHHHQHIQSLSAHFFFQDL